MRVGFLDEGLEIRCLGGTDYDDGVVEDGRGGDEGLVRGGAVGKRALVGCDEFVDELVPGEGLGHGGEVGGGGARVVGDDADGEADEGLRRGILLRVLGHVSSAVGFGATGGGLRGGQGDTKAVGDAASEAVVDAVEDGVDVADFDLFIGDEADFQPVRVHGVLLRVFVLAGEEDGGLRVRVVLDLVSANTAGEILVAKVVGAWA